jgi:cholesterol transport system auxiliary component
MSRPLRAWVASLFALFAAACVTIASGPGAQRYFVLQDTGSAVPERPAPDIALSLVVTGSATAAFYDAENLVFSRATGQRAYYQLAAWTERPARRIADIVRQRLRDRGRIATVAAPTSGVRADVVLEVAVEDFYHDAAASPSLARVILVCEIVDWRTRALLGRQRFAAVAALETEDAAGAAAALSRATAQAVDALAPWVESIVAGQDAGR